VPPGGIRLLTPHSRRPMLTMKNTEHLAMATAVAFDTLELARKLEAAGFEHEPAADTDIAEAMAEAMATAELATKADIREAELRLDARITAVEAKIRESELRLEAKLEARLGELKADILKWVAGLLLAQAAVIATLVKLL